MTDRRAAGSGLGALAIAAAFFIAGAGAAHADTSDEAVERGRMVYLAAGCEGCHTATTDDAVPLAGGHEFDTPFGVFRSPNITPHETDGIGRWSLADFRRALREGRAPDGSAYYPVFPYSSYTWMVEDDIRDLFAYLGSREPVSQPNEPHSLRWPFSWRLLNRGWQAAFLEPGPWRDRPDRSEAWNRGAYLSRALAHCGECHTRRGLGGATDTAWPLAGSPTGPGGGAVPNITPHEDGIGGWSVDDIVYYLETGALPNGDYAGGAMAEVIDNGLGKLPQEDLEAIATYIKSLRPQRTRDR